MQPVAAGEGNWSPLASLPVQLLSAFGQGLQESR
jgi:hypothetical protein